MLIAGFLVKCFWWRYFLEKDNRSFVKQVIVKEILFFFDTSFEKECSFLLKNFLPNQNQNLATEEDKGIFTCIGVCWVSSGPWALPGAEDEGK